MLDHYVETVAHIPHVLTDVFSSAVQYQYSREEIHCLYLNQLALSQYRKLQLAAVQLHTNRTSSSTYKDECPLAAVYPLDFNWHRRFCTKLTGTWPSPASMGGLKVVLPTGSLPGASPCSWECPMGPAVVRRWVRL
jgi:hypothetical protein